MKSASIWLSFPISLPSLPSPRCSLYLQKTRISFASFDISAWLLGGSCFCTARQNVILDSLRGTRESSWREHQKSVWWQWRCGRSSRWCRRTWKCSSNVSIVDHVRHLTMRHGANETTRRGTLGPQLIRRNPSSFPQQPTASPFIHRARSFKLSARVSAFQPPNCHVCNGKPQSTFAAKHSPPGEAWNSIKMKNELEVWRKKIQIKINSTNSGDVACHGTASSFPFFTCCER